MYLEKVCVYQSCIYQFYVNQNYVFIKMISSAVLSTYQNYAVTDIFPF